MAVVKFNGHNINFDKKIVKGKKVLDFINEIEPNIERIIRTCKINNIQPFDGSRNKLKEWLISNQEGYNKYISEVYDYFVEKCKL